MGNQLWPGAVWSTQFRFLNLVARDLRGLANINLYFSFVFVLNTLGSSTEHYCEVDETIKNEINETVKELKSESVKRTENSNNNYTL